MAGQKVEGLSYSLRGTAVNTYTGEFSGTPAVMADGADVAANYNVTTTPGKLTITASEIAGKVHLTTADASKVYDGQPLAAGTATAVDDNGNPVKVEYSANGADWTENASDVTATAVADSKTVQVRASVEGTYTGYVSGTQSLAVTPAPAIITVNSDTKVYNAPDPTFSGTVSGLVANSDLGEITYGRLAADANKENVGDDITLTASYTDNGNYDVSVTNGKLTITPSDANAIVATGVTKTYDGQVASIVANAAQPNSTIEYSVDGQNWTTNNPTFTDVGTYTVQARAINPNFAQVFASADVVVSPATITVTANNQTKVAGTADPELTYAFSGVVNNEVARFMGGLQREAGEDVGSYAINQGDLALVDNGDFRASNYMLEFVPGTLTVTAALVPLTPPPAPTPEPTPTTPIGTVPEGPLEPALTPIVQALEDAVTPLAGPQEETISDNDNPLAGYDRVNCWVHYYLILGIIVTVIYGGGVLVRRINFTRKLKGYEDDVLGVEDETATATAAAPMATEGKEA